MRYFTKFSKLTAAKKIILIEAYILLGVFQIIIATIAFKHIAPRLGEHMQESSFDCNENEIPVIKMVAWAVKTISRHTFWDCKCLVQALTAKYMLRRRNITNTLYLGLARDEQPGIIAHAWLRSGKILVTGEKGKEVFTTLASFGDI